MVLRTVWGDYGCLEHYSAFLLHFCIEAEARTKSAGCEGVVQDT